ncbi:uncharacterized protein LOC103362413 isoform X2 [Stegastes partitus]|uniref:Uncharacterized protein LOC103362413 isoform X2 n=1 Tax=Stegastes partitus TaxID=144197 RepID=A0A9Y4K5F4_9TELE|nr:PREDICTED: uncharacterized protein LOC103362413 isoform X2 [Stegastes partitus]
MSVPEKVTVQSERGAAERTRKRKDEDQSRKSSERPEVSAPRRKIKTEQNTENKSESCSGSKPVGQHMWQRSSFMTTMRLKSQLCFLVLVISSVSRGRSQTADSPPAVVPTPLLLNETKDDANGSIASNLTLPLAPAEAVSMPSTDSVNATTTEGSTSPVPPYTSVMTVSMVTDHAPSTDGAAEDKPSPSSWGYVVLALILLVIVVLCVILYFLRRVSRTYSFDLQRPGPVDHLNLPIGTFEPVYVDDLERPTPKENTTSEEAAPAANGTSVQPEETSWSEQNAAQEHPDVNGLETSPARLTSNTSETSETSGTSGTGVSLDADPVEPLEGPSLMFSDAGEQQNENNNNPSVRSSDPFVEINLDEPVCCDQLLTSPEAPSSVLPFSPFSFSSSS